MVLIIVMFASFVMPNFNAQRNSREVTKFFVALPDLAVYARDMAQESNSTTRIRYDESTGQFTVSQDTSTDTVDSSLQDSDDKGTTLRQLTMPDLLSVDVFRSGDDDVTSADWEIEFYPDGRSSGGGLQIDDYGRDRSMLVEPTGEISTDNQALPTVEERRWAAGQLEQRTTGDATQ